MEEEGLSTGSCDLCGAAFTRAEPVLEALPTLPTTQPPEVTEAQPSTLPTQPIETVHPEKTPYAALLALAGCTIGAIVCIILLIPRKRRRGKYSRKR